MFNDFIHVNKEDMTLLGASVLKSKAQDKAIQDKIDDLIRTCGFAPCCLTVLPDYS